MLPVANVVASPAPIQVPLVSTVMPNAIATIRVPADTVAASVSIPPVSNDSGGGGNAYAALSSAAPPALSVAEAGITGTFLISSGAGFWASPQATFLAQVIGQGISPETRTILIQYEKLMALAQVKYRPSNATLPMPEPSGVFGQLLKHEAAHAPEPAAPIAAPAAAAEKVTVTANVQPAEIVRPAPAPVPARPARNSSSAALATQAYQATVALNAPRAADPAASSIEEIGSAA